MNDLLLKVGAAALAVAALVAGYGVWASHQQGIGYARAKTEAAEALRVETAKVSDLNLQLSNALVERNNKDQTNAKTVSTLSRELSVARLRDPNASRPAACPAAGGTVDSDGDRAEAGGLLSAELTGLLARTQREADEINAAYISSREDGRKLRERGCAP